jgi:hypothetical protein
MAHTFYCGFNERTPGFSPPRRCPKMSGNVRFSSPFSCPFSQTRGRRSTPYEGPGLSAVALWSDEIAELPRTSQNCPLLRRMPSQVRQAYAAVTFSRSGTSRQSVSSVTSRPMPRRDITTIRSRRRKRPQGRSHEATGPASRVGEKTSSVSARITCDDGSGPDPQRPREQPARPARESRRAGTNQQSCRQRHRKP